MTTTPDSVDALENLLRASGQRDVLHAQYMGKAMPDDVYTEFTRLRDEAIPRLRAELAATQVAAGAPLDERVAFEAAFELPGGTAWDGTRYVVDDEYMFSYWCERFLGQWEAWQARAALSAPQGANVEENSEERLSAYDHKVIADFLARTGKWVTNDASRDAAIAAAIQADRMERGASAAALSAPQGAQPVPTDDEINALYVETFESAHGVARSAPKAPPLVQKFARAVLSRWATPIAQQAPAAPVAAQGAAERAVPAGMVAVPRVVYEALLGWYDPKGDSMAAVRPLVAAIGDMLVAAPIAQQAPAAPVAQPGTVYAALDQEAISFASEEEIDVAVKAYAAYPFDLPDTRGRVAAILNAAFALRASRTQAPAAVAAPASTALRFTEEVGEDSQHTVRRADSGFPIAVLTNYCRSEREAFAKQFAGSSELLDAANEALEICRLYGGPQLPRLFQAVAAIAAQEGGTKS